MKIRIWGARGSVPSPIKPEVVEEKIYRAILQMPNINTSDESAVWAYVKSLPVLLRGTAGGNTACVEIQTGDEIFIIDAGSGLRELGQELLKGPCGRGEGIIHLFLSHPHWDHIQGFPFFAPAFIPGNQIYIYSIHNLQKALIDQQRPLNFPVSLSYMRAKRSFITLKEGKPITIGPLKVNTIANAHPGVAYSYRFEDAHSIFVYASDAEYKNLDETSIRPYLDFFENADALLFDAQYTLREAWQKVDWGHSSAMIGVDMARAAGAKRLLLFHHDPTYSDDELVHIQETALAYQQQNTALPTCEVVIAYEGLTIDLTPPGTIDLHFAPDSEAAILTPSSIFNQESLLQLEQKLEHLSQQEKHATPIIDLSQIETLTTAGLKSLINLHRKKEGLQIVLANASASTREVIKLSGYQDVFAIYPSVAVALTAIQSREALNLPGQLVKGRYRIEQTIGESHFGTVLKATDTQQNQPVALKILSPFFSAETVTRFVEYAQPLIKLTHPNINKVLDWEKTPNYAFLVEVFIQGNPLQTLLEQRDAPLSMEQTLSIAWDITLALDYAHGMHVLHGDLKPQNIFLTPTGTKVTGFGLGYLDQGRNLLNAPMLFLSAPYLAPEQILGQPLDHRTDLYALGVIFYQLFTGHLPFAGTTQALMQAHLTQPPPAPQSLNPEISPMLGHVILKLLAKNPDERYGSARQVLGILSSLKSYSGFGGNNTKGPVEQYKPVFDKIKQYWEKAVAAEGQLVFIGGEAGIEKTTFIHQLAQYIQPPVLLIGRCHPPQTDTPYRPFSDALHRYLADFPAVLNEPETCHLASMFAQLLPELRADQLNCPPPPPLPAKDGYLRLLSGLTQFIRQQTQARPWMLVLEDLHLADQSTLELLHFLTSHLSQMSLLILATHHHADLDEAHPLSQIWQTLRADKLVYHQLLIDGLTQSAVAQMLHGLWSDAIPPQLVAKIHQHTKGNPLYVEEIARGLIDDGLVFVQNGTWHFPTADAVKLPQTLREVIWRRVHHLHPDTQTLLRQSAVLGGTFRLADLQAISGLSEWEILEQLEPAFERQLVYEISGKGAFSHRHSETQHVLYADIGLTRQRLLHRQTAAALEHHPASTGSIEKVAYHYYAANLFEKAIPYGIKAAQKARQLYANPEAYQWYTQTLAMLNQLSPQSMPNYHAYQTSIHQALGQVLTQLESYKEAAEHYAYARKLLETPSAAEAHRQRLAELCRQAAESYLEQRDYEQALEFLADGLRYIGNGSPSEEAARITLLGGEVYSRQYKNEQAINWISQSQRSAQSIEHEAGQKIIASGNRLLAAIQLKMGNDADAVALCQQSLAIWQTLNNPLQQALTFNQLAEVYLMQADWPKMQNCLQQSETIFNEIGSVLYTPKLNRLWGVFYLHTEQLDPALQYARCAVALATAYHVLEEEGRSRRLMGQLYIARGNYTQAESVLGRSLKTFSALKDQYELAQTYLPLAQAVSHTHSPERGTWYLSQAAQIFELLNMPVDRQQVKKLQRSFKNRLNT